MFPDELRQLLVTALPVLSALCWRFLRRRLARWLNGAISLLFWGIMLLGLVFVLFFCFRGG